MQTLLRFVGASLLIACAALHAPAQSAFQISGGGGLIPPSGTGGTTGWPTGIPNPKFVSSSSSSMPADAFRLTHLEIQGLEHTWVGDVHVVLESPQQIAFTILHRPGFQGTTPPFNAGNRSNLLPGTYTFVETGGAQIPHVPDTVPENPIFPGTYVQDFGNPAGGVWPNGQNNILNVPLSQIPAAPGVWRLVIYDWAVGDTGACTGWSLHGLRSPTPYCTAGTSTSGCQAQIAADSNPSVSAAHPCTIVVSGVNGQRSGLIFYGIDNSGWWPLPWASGSSSWLCVKPPTQRTPVQQTGGTFGSCNGTLSLDWNAFQAAFPTALGKPWSAGDDVYAQGWYRDPASPKGTQLSNGLQLGYEP
jgi:subtilisin-like proprotein convertase family protein